MCKRQGQSSHKYVPYQASFGILNGNFISRTRVQKIALVLDLVTKSGTKLDFFIFFSGSRSLEKKNVVRNCLFVEL